MFLTYSFEHINYLQQQGLTIYQIFVWSEKPHTS